MTELVFLYTFFGLMLFNILASLFYIMGFNQMKLALVRTIKRRKPR